MERWIFLGDFLSKSAPAFTREVYTEIITLVKKSTSLPFGTVTQCLCSIHLLPRFRILTCSLPAQYPITSASISSEIKTHLSVLIDLVLGQMLGRLHSGVQNDCLRLPVTVGNPLDPLHEVESKDDCKSLELPFNGLRRCLSRAIAFYLFNDVEVPCLVWFTGSENDIYVTLPPLGSNDPPNIVAILPNLAHALWDDPHESFFLPPDPRVL